MNKQQGIKEHNRSLAYLQSNKLRPFFHELTKLLVIRQPEDPIQFLVEYLQKRNKRQVICIQGYDQQSRVKLAKNISNKFNFKIIELAELYKGVADWHSKPDKQINEKVIAELMKVQSVYKGVLISGYPNNIVQADFIQKSQFLPQRYFIMNNNQSEIRKTYQQKYEGNVDKLIQRNRLQIKELNQVLGDQSDILPVQFDKALDKIVQTISLKFNKKSVPNDSPRIIVLYPPYLKPQSSQTFVEVFSLNPIQINGILKKLSHKEGFMTHVESYIRKHKTISKQIELAMIETIAKNATSKNKGYVLYGWPVKKDRLPLLKEHFLNPQLIMVFDENKEKSLQKFNSLNSQNADLFAINKKPSQQQYQKIYEQYHEVVEDLRGKTNVHIFSSQQTPDKIIKTFTSLMDNPKIYS